MRGMSCLGTLMENIAIYVEHYLKPIGKSHNSYFKDTSDFLRCIEKTNKVDFFFYNFMLVVIVVIGLHENIPPDEGVQNVGEELQENLNIHKFFKQFNLIHPTIMFTMTHKNPNSCQKELPLCTCPTAKLKTEKL